MTLQHVCYCCALSLARTPDDVAACLLLLRPVAGEDIGLCCSMFVVVAAMQVQVKAAAADNVRPTIADFEAEENAA